MSECFTGTIEPFAEVDTAGVQDHHWETWADALVPLAVDLTEKHYPNCVMGGTGLFILDPGQMHPVHTDIQPPEWVVRVHIPMLTNPYCFAAMDDGYHQMDVGKAYRFNTRRPHAVANAGKTVRVHLVFDIKEK